MPKNFPFHINLLWRETKKMLLIDKILFNRIADLWQNGEHKRRKKIGFIGSNGKRNICLYIYKTIQLIFNIQFNAIFLRLYLSHSFSLFLSTFRQIVQFKHIIFCVLVHVNERSASEFAFGVCIFNNINLWLVKLNWVSSANQEHKKRRTTTKAAYSAEFGCEHNEFHYKTEQQQPTVESI